MKKRFVAVLCAAVMSMTFCAGTVAHADDFSIRNSSRSATGTQSTTATQSKSKYQSSTKPNITAEDLLKSYRVDDDDETSKTSVTTQSKSKYRSSTKTTTTAKSESKYQSSEKFNIPAEDLLKAYRDDDETSKTSVTTQSKSKYRSSTKTTTTAKSESKYQSSTKPNITAEDLLKSYKVDDDDETSNAIQDKQKYMKYYEEFNPQKTMHLKKSGKIFKCDSLKTWYFYHFGDTSFNSVGRTGEVFHGLSTGKLFSAKIYDNRNLAVKFKTITGSAKLNDIKIESNNDTTEKLNYTFIPDENKLKADLYDASFRNGFYRITITYDDTEHAYIYLYINCASDDPEDYGFYLCYAEQHCYSENFNPTKRQKYITDLIESEGVTPENACDNSYIVYPSVADKYNCDTPYWINKAHELLDENITKYSSSVCAFILHDWMTSNLTYDWYKINHRNGYQRYYKSTTQADPSQYMSKNKTGVCLDYAIVYTIMCREFNIPCVVLSNNTHAWNAIYIDGEWVEVDITADINRYTYNEDVNDVEGDQLYDYSGFMTYSVNNALPDTATRFCFQ